VRQDAQMSLGPDAQFLCAKMRKKYGRGWSRGLVRQDAQTEGRGLVMKLVRPEARNFFFFFDFCN